ncbi:MAG: MBOAT family protein, partial [Lachnospiraceae bacterium]|nr:MBOAT family protein [Lachnospiraceae bacterium]
PQLFEEHFFDYDKAAKGMKQMAWGFFKKMVIADSLAKYVDLVFNNVGEYTGFAVVLAMVFFSIQIYCDFSGYSDIAIGTAKLLGIDLMQNFNCPYFSGSIHEFWSRWHISLSTWFRDYVYIPLGGNRVSKPRHYLNLMITFLASGLWHGASFTFVVWGGLHGVLQIIENLLFGRKLDGGQGLGRALRVVVVFVLATFAWVFFRANATSDIPILFGSAAKGWASPAACIADGFSALSLDAMHGCVLAGAILLLFIYDYISLKNDPWELVGQLNTPLRYVIYAVLLAIILLFQAPGENAFVYFQF